MMSSEVMGTPSASRGRSPPTGSGRRSCATPQADRAHHAVVVHHDPLLCDDVGRCRRWSVHRRRAPNPRSWVGRVHRMRRARFVGIERTISAGSGVDLDGPPPWRAQRPRHRRVVVAVDKQRLPHAPQHTANNFAIAIDQARDLRGRQVVVRLERLQDLRLVVEHGARLRGARGDAASFSRLAYDVRVDAEHPGNLRIGHESERCRVPRESRRMMGWDPTLRTLLLHGAVAHAELCRDRGVRHASERHGAPVDGRPMPHRRHLARDATARSRSGADLRRRRPETGSPRRGSSRTSPSRAHVETPSPRRRSPRAAHRRARSLGERGSRRPRQDHVDAVTGALNEAGA